MAKIASDLDEGWGRGRVPGWGEGDESQDPHSPEGSKSFFFELCEDWGGENSLEIKGARDHIRDPPPTKEGKVALNSAKIGAGKGPWMMMEGDFIKIRLPQRRARQ
jgi:hypothetical protein